MQKIVLAPDSFKGSLASGRVCDILEESARRFFPEADIVKVPASDGGEGLVNAVLLWRKGQRISKIVKDPVFRPVRADYALLDDGTAVIEIAAASGLPLLERELRNPLKTTTFGTGQLIKDALDNGAKRLILGLGGSATNDGGVGAASALGMQFYAADGKEIDPTGAGLARLVAVDATGMDERLRSVDITIACDVNNPLYGPNGASYIYGPQKGATDSQVKQLDENLRHFADILVRQTGQNVQAIPGIGAAGGAALPLVIFADAKLKSGIDIALDMMNFAAHLEGCDLVVTGEGQTDDQSVMGKAIFGISQRAKESGVPVVVISGALKGNYFPLRDRGVVAFFDCTPRAASIKELLAESEQNLKNAADSVFSLVSAVK